MPDPPTQVEMVGSSWRSWANTATSTGWVAGYMSLPVLAYCLPDMRHMEVGSRVD